MRIWLNGKPLVLVLGMTVRQALIQVDLLQEIKKGAKVFDEWGNEMGLDGALEEGSRIKVVLTRNREKDHGQSRDEKLLFTSPSDLQKKIRQEKE